MDEKTLEYMKRRVEKSERLIKRIESLERVILDGEQALSVDDYTRTTPGSLTFFDSYGNKTFACHENDLTKKTFEHFIIEAKKQKENLEKELLEI